MSTNPLVSSPYVVVHAADPSTEGGPKRTDVFC